EDSGEVGRKISCLRRALAGCPRALNARLRFLKPSWKPSLFNYARGGIAMKAFLARVPRPILVVAAGLLLAGGLGGLFAGCKGTDAPNVDGPLKLKVAYIGLTCEPPLFVAYEKGFYKEEGLDVELVSTNWDGLQAGLGLGKFHANHTLLM